MQISGGFVRSVTFVGMLCASLPQVKADSGALDALPEEFLGALQRAGISYGWRAMNCYFHAYGNEAEDKNNGDHEIENARHYASSLLSDHVIDLLRAWAELQGWYCAQAYYGWSEKYQTGRKCDEKRAALKSSGEMTDRVLDGLHEMLEKVAWYTAVARDQGTCQESRSNKASSDAAKDDIKGDVVMENIQIHANTANVAASTPQVIGVHTNVNAGNVAQSVSYTYSHSEGETSSWSNSFGVTVGLTEEIKVSAGFLGSGAESNTKFSLESSFSHTWGGGRSSGVTRSYHFTLDTPPHCTYRQIVTVHEAKVDAYYTMTLSMGNSRFKRTGKWYGVASSTVTVKTEAVEEKRLFSDVGPIAAPDHKMSTAVAAVAIAMCVGGIAAALALIRSRRSEPALPLAE